MDGVVVHSSPTDAVAARGDRNVPLLIGTNQDEGTLFSLLLPTDVTNEQILAALPETIIDPGVVGALYAGRDTGRWLIVDLLTDAVFLVPTLRLADAQAAASAPVWVYLFSWKTPVFGGLLGATHALELPFLWDKIDDPLWQTFVGENAPRSLVTAMQDAWIAFARTGEPNARGPLAWPRYDSATRPTLEFGDEIRIVEDPCKELREVWYGASVPS